MLPRPSSKASKFSQPRRGDGVRPGQGYHRRRQRGVVPFEVGFGASGRAVRAGLASRLRLICVCDVDEVPLEDPEQLLSAFTCPPPNAFARSAARRAPDRPRSWVRRRASPDSSLVRLLAIFIRADVSMRMQKTQNPHSAERALSLAFGANLSLKRHRHCRRYLDCLPLQPLPFLSLKRHRPRLA